jgi:hypothetical protein
MLLCGPLNIKCGFHCSHSVHPRKSPILYGTWQFITVFTETCYWSLSVNPADTLWPYFLKNHPSIIFPPTRRSPRWCLPFRFCDLTNIHTSQLIHACFMPSSSHPSWFGNPANILLSVQIMKSPCYAVQRITHWISTLNLALSIFSFWTHSQSEPTRQELFTVAVWQRSMGKPLGCRTLSWKPMSFLPLIWTVTWDYLHSCGTLKVWQRLVNWASNFFTQVSPASQTNSAIF